MFSREVLPLDIFKTHLVKALRNLIWSHRWSYFKQEIGLQTLEAPPSPPYPLTHWLLELMVRDGCHSSVAAPWYLHRAKNFCIKFPVCFQPSRPSRDFRKQKCLKCKCQICLWSLNCDQLQSMKPIFIHYIHPPMFSRAVLHSFHCSTQRSQGVLTSVGFQKKEYIFKELVLLM